MRREVPEAQAHAEAVITLCHEQGFPAWLAWGIILQGWVQAEQGHGEEGIAKMRGGLDALQATGARVTRPGFLGVLARAYGKVGQAEEGLPLLAEALALVHETGERLEEAELYRLKGELTLQQSQDAEPAESCFHKAIEIARQQQAKSWELRAAISLARLWQQQGKQAEARELLAPVYDWFTEGFDTKDLQEAKVLLEELQ